MKKIILICTICSIVLLNAVSFAFSDVADTHWAKDAIDNMVKEGVIAGYTDGTFRPSRQISKIESLILFSKIAGVNIYTEAADTYLTNYTSTLSKYETTYKKQVAYLLGIGVLKESELDNYLSAENLNSPLKREEMAVLITKILGAEEEVKNKSVVVLNFSDTEDISASAKPYVEYVYTNGIMKGMTDTEFSPATGTTRAQVAIILDSIISKVNFKPEVSQNTTPEQSSNLSITSGTIEEVDTLLRTIEIDKSIYEYNDSTKFYIDGVLSDEYDIKKEMEIKNVTIEDGIITKLEIQVNQYEIDTASSDITGIIKEISISTSTIITLDISGKDASYYITGSTKFYTDGEKTKISDFEIKDEVRLILDDGNIVSMSKGDEKSKTYKIGEISSVSDKTFIIELENGVTEKIYLDSSYVVLDSADGDELKLSKLYEEDKVIVFGDYSSEKFYATVIVLYY